MKKDAVIMMRLSKVDRERLLTKAKKKGLALSELIRFTFYNYKEGLLGQDLKLDKALSKDKNTAYMLRLEAKLRDQMREEAKAFGVTLSRFTRSLAKQYILNKK